MAEIRRLRVTVTCGPADIGSLTLFRWVVAWVIHLHATAPGDVPIRFRVEVLPEDEEPRSA